MASVPSVRSVPAGTARYHAWLIWEEDGKPVGIINLNPKGLDQTTWVIGNVAVLPAFRRRGIGRTLVTPAITLARDKKAKTVTLDVISDNYPAVKLYEDLGFHRYSGEVQLERQPDVEPAARIPMPSNYSMLQYQLKNWRYRYVLAKRSTPSDVQQ